eukprot:TRINITY_DN4859_c0_g2_i1.p1 TRINITY_DN4859_c0_g2~~TRINITY_DN4859_c0_g2_i1.p1  ORF type:complete len:332 (-),score=79.73 TRINITY_DN4859_c0_g2_i1:7-1002(-)
MSYFFFFQAEDGIRDAQESRGLGDVYKRQGYGDTTSLPYSLLPCPLHLKPAPPTSSTFGGGLNPHLYGSADSADVTNNATSPTAASGGKSTGGKNAAAPTGPPGAYPQDSAALARPLVPVLLGVFDLFPAPIVEDIYALISTDLSAQAEFAAVFSPNTIPQSVNAVSGGGGGSGNASGGTVESALAARVEAILSGHAYTSGNADGAADRDITTAPPSTANAPISAALAAAAGGPAPIVPPSQQQVEATTPGVSYPSQCNFYAPPSVGSVPVSVLVRYFAQLQRRASGGLSGQSSAIKSASSVGVVSMGCLLYTSDAADEEDSVDLGGRRII